MMSQLSAACSHSHFVRLFQKQLLQVIAQKEIHLQRTVYIIGSQDMAGTLGLVRQVGGKALGWRLNKSSALWVVVDVGAA